VRLQAVRKLLGPVTAVAGVELVIRGGEFVTLLGPSGSGKTTTVNMIAGFEFPTDGDIFINERPVTYLPAYKRDIGMVFQNYALFPHMTVSENIAFPLEMRRVGRAEREVQVREALSLVRLGGLGGRYPRQLSGGQQQRVALARALVFRPAVLLMDEPLGALDKKLRSEMQLEIKHLHEQLRITVIYVTHDQEEALTMSDRVAVMHEGRIVQCGTPREVYEHPVDRFVASFLGESNFIDVEVVECDGRRVRVRTRDGVVFSASVDGQVPAGTKGCMVVRPEHVTLGERAGGLDNIFDARVDEVVYVGGASRYLLRAGLSSDPILAVTQNVRGKDLRLGDAIRIGWSSEDGRLLMAAP
jgi:spermidine/putrescine ABC transporter ATP-binding subunit